jgi:hypothetical protein
MAWDKWTSLTCEVVSAGAMLATVWIAWRALRTWRDEVLGSSRFELARSILYNAHLLARGIQSYRSVFSQQDRTPEGIHRSINEPAAELDRAFIEARFLFPSEMLEKERKELKACVDDLYIATRRQTREMNKPEDTQDREKLQEYDAIIWSPGDDDPFMKRVEKAVESLTETLRPFVATRRCRRNSDGQDSTKPAKKA